jgi:hypothetical protein
VKSHAIALLLDKSTRTKLREGAQALSDVIESGGASRLC